MHRKSHIVPRNTCLADELHQIKNCIFALLTRLRQQKLIHFSCPTSLYWAPQLVHQFVSCSVGWHLFAYGKETQKISIISLGWYKRSLRIFLFFFLAVKKEIIAKNYREWRMVDKLRTKRWSINNKTINEVCTELLYNGITLFTTLFFWLFYEHFQRLHSYSPQPIDGASFP